jgi:hypothetical protein
MNVIQANKAANETGTHPLQQRFEIYQNGTNAQALSKGKNH